MKNNITKLAVIALTITGALSQIGCGPFMYDTTCEGSQPDHFETQSSEISQTFNGKSVAITSDEWADAFFNRNLGFNFDWTTNVSPVMTIDNKAISSISYVQTYLDWGWYNDLNLPILNDFPITEGETKIYNVSVDIEADYYTIENTINGKKAHLPPTGNYLQYAGWTSDNSFQIQDANYGDGYQGPLNKEVVTVLDPSTMELDLNGEYTDKSTPIKNFPDSSPMGNFKVYMQSKIKTWDETIKVTVIKNSNLIYQIESTIKLHNGDDTMTKVISDTYKIVPAHSYEYECNTWG